MLTHRDIWAFLNYEKITQTQTAKSSPEVVDVLKFGSWNVDGLDPGTHEALNPILPGLLGM